MDVSDQLNRRPQFHFDTGQFLDDTGALYSSRHRIPVGPDQASPAELCPSEPPDHDPEHVPQPFGAQNSQHWDARRTRRFTRIGGSLTRVWL